MVIESEFEQVQRACPTPLPASEVVVRRAKESLMAKITLEEATHHRSAPPTARPASVGRATHRMRTVLRIAGASMAAAAVIGVVVARSTTPHHEVPTVSAIGTTATPAQVLESAAKLVAYTRPSPGSGEIRHIRFRNESDPGAPVYDAYIRPDGSAMVGKAGGPLKPTQGYLSAAAITSLPSNPVRLRPALSHLATTAGYNGPGESPERGIFRISVDLLADPSVDRDVKAAIFRVLEKLDLNAIHARNLGAVTDPAGRHGIGLSFGFEEGTTEVLVLDRTTGALLSDTTRLADGSPFAGQVYLADENLTAIPGISA